MRITIEKRIQKDIQEASRHMGIHVKEIADRALLLYLESVKKILELEREFHTWDALSDESFHKLVRQTPSRHL